MQNSFKVLLLLQAFYLINCQVPLSSFYAYGPSNGDNSLPKVDDGTYSLSLSRSFQFFQRSYSYVYTCTNGFIDFLNNMGSSFASSSFPDNKMVGVAPLWYDIDTNRGGDVFYREANQTAHLAKITQDIRASFATMGSDINFAFIATWSNVCERGSSNCTAHSSTFQVAIASNGAQTFLVYKYNAIDQLTTRRIQSGYNDAQSFNYYSAPGSQTSAVKQTLLTQSNVNTPGLWIFRVDDYQTGPIKPPITQIQNGSYLGNYNIKLSGPVYSLSDSVSIKYQNETLNRACRVLSTSEASCPVPFLNKPFGDVAFDVQINNVKTLYGTFKTVISNNDIQNDIHTAAETFYNPNAVIYFSWSNKYSGHKMVAAGVTHSSLGTPSAWTKTVLPDVSLSQSITVRIDQIVPDILKSQSFIIYILDSNNNLVNSSKQFFYFSWQSYSAKSCQTWYQTEGDISAMRNETLKTFTCPSYVSVPVLSPWPATIASAKFEVDDRCRVGDLCPFNFGAEACYRSKEATVNGYGHKCCYNKNGYLNNGILSGGGAMRKYHPVSPVSYWNYMHFDVLPYIWCCENSNYCNLYEEKRPSA